MAKKTDTPAPPPRWAISRRDFLRWTGLGGAALSAPGLLAACAAGPGADGTSLVLEDLVVDSWRNLYRDHDMVVLQLGLVNLRLSGTPPVLTRIAAGAPTFILLSFQPQHVFEPFFPDPTATTPPPAPPPLPVGARLAQPSRLVFAVPDSVASIGNTITDILAVCRLSGLRVNRNAVGRLNDSRAPGVVSGPADPGAPHALDPFETCIELPTRLSLSPNQYARFDHASDPVISDEGRVELWHTRMGTSGRAGGAIRMDDRARRTVRAISTVTSPPLADGLPNDTQRQQIVDLSGNWASGTPKPIEVRQMTLSALGGTMDVTLDGPPPPLSDPTRLSGWLHRTSFGRDAEVRVAYLGYVFPFGHPAALVDVVERAIVPGSSRPALLYKSRVLVLRKEECKYEQKNVPSDVLGAARQMPFQSVRFLTLEAHERPRPRFTALPEIPTYLIDAEVVDRAGRTHQLNVPVSFLPSTVQANDTALAEAMEVFNRNAKLAIVTHGKRMAVAPPDRLDDTTFTTQALMMSGAKITAAAGAPPFHPVMRKAWLDVDAVRAMTGDSAPHEFYWAKEYVDHGLPAADAPVTHGNARQLLLQMIDPNPILGTPPPNPPPRIAANFGKQADRSGGFLTPSMGVKALSRLGGAVSSTAAAAGGVFDAADAFASDVGAGDIGGVLPKLFGCINLVDILGKGALDKVVPKFVSKALTVGERLFDEAQRIFDLITELYGLVGDIAGIVLPEQNAFRANALLQEPENTLQTIVNRLNDLKEKLTAAKEAYANITQRLAGLAAEDIEARVQEIEDGVDAFVSDLIPLGVDDLLAALDSAAARQLYKRYPKLEVPLRMLEKVVRTISELVPEDALEKLKAAYKAVLQGIEAVRDGSAHLEWEPPLRDFGPFRVTDRKGRLRLAADMRMRAKGDAKAGVDLLCTLDNFDINLEVVILEFEKLQYRQRMGKKAEVDVIFGGVTFAGKLGFVNKLTSIIPMDGFSDPPYVDVSASGLKAGFDLALPDIAVGMYAMQHMSICSQLDVPFLGDALAFRFGFCSRENPFVVQVAWYGGGGFFALELTPSGISAVESAIEFGARLSLALGPISGCVEAMGGTYFGLFFTNGALTIKVSGYLRLRGEVDVAGLISAGLEVTLEMTYLREGNKNLLEGSATVKFHVSLCFFHKTFKRTVKRRFAGGSDEASHKRQANLLRQRTATGAISVAEVLDYQSGSVPPAWTQYWEAFAQ